MLHPELENISTNDKRPIVFLDRDGTLIKNIPYLSDPKAIMVLPDVISGLSILKERFQFVVVTNQSGVGRKKITTEDVRLIHSSVTNIFKSFDINLNQFIFCTHHPNQKCGCRKPNTLMLKTILDLKDIQSKYCYLIGDSETDLAAGNLSKIKSYLVRSKYSTDEVMENSGNGSNFLEICDRILMKSYTGQEF